MPTTHSTMLGTHVGVMTDPDETLETSSLGPVMAWIQQVGAGVGRRYKSLEPYSWPPSLSGFGHFSILFIHSFLHLFLHSAGMSGRTQQEGPRSHPQGGPTWGTQSPQAAVVQSNSC